MQYEHRFCNGYWTLFDTKAYAGIDTFWNLSDAMEAAQDANAGGKWNRCNAVERDGLAF